MKRACEIDEAAFGSSHHLATDLHNLAWLMKDTNRLPEAEKLIRRASQIDEDTLGQTPQPRQGSQWTCMVAQRYGPTFGG